MKLFIFLIFTTASLLGHSQIFMDTLNLENVPKVNIADVEKTETFLRFDKRYSFKNIKFESTIAQVKQNVKIKSTIYPEMYDLPDGNFRTWGELFFDEGQMLFNKGGKFKTVQLIHYEKSTDDEFFKKAYDYLAKVFGINPTIYELVGKCDFFWSGDKLCIGLSKNNAMGGRWTTSLSITSEKLAAHQDKLENM